MPSGWGGKGKGAELGAEIFIVKYYLDKNDANPARAAASLEGGDGDGAVLCRPVQPRCGAWVCFWDW